MNSCRWDLFEVNCPRAIILDGCFPEDNCPGAINLDGNCLGEDCPGGNYLRTIIHEETVLKHRKSNKIKYLSNKNSVKNT